MTTQRSLLQQSLFTDADLHHLQSRPDLNRPHMSAATLHQWKAKIARYQATLRHQPAQQTLLGDEGAAPPLADSLDPFSLPQQTTEFWRGRAADEGIAALYFVIDHLDGPSDGQPGSSLLLYVGETVKSEQRWRGEHDCKRYLDNYRSLHYHYGCPTQVSIAFWRGAPAATRPRQQLELALIHKWRSPFNKENWSRWGMPFVGTS